MKSGLDRKAYLCECVYRYHKWPTHH